MGTSKHPMYAIFLLFGLVLGSSAVAGGQGMHATFRVVGEDLYSPYDHFPAPYISQRYIHEAPRKSPQQAHQIIQVNLRLRINVLRELATDPSAAGAFVLKNMRNQNPHLKLRLRISIGEEEAPRRHERYVVPAMQNIYDSLASMGLHDPVRVTAEETNVGYPSGSPPSRCACKDEAHLPTGVPLETHTEPSSNSDMGPQYITLPFSFFAPPYDAPYEVDPYKGHFGAHSQQRDSTVETISLGKGGQFASMGGPFDVNCGAQGPKKPTSDPGHFRVETSPYKGHKGPGKVEVKIGPQEPNKQPELYQMCFV